MSYVCLMNHDSIPPPTIHTLEPDTLYWARRTGSQSLEVVMISKIFGDGRDFWSVAVIGSDQHYTLDEFEFVAVAAPPER